MCRTGTRKVARLGTRCGMCEIVWRQEYYISSIYASIPEQMRCRLVQRRSKHESCFQSDCDGRVVKATLLGLCLPSVIWFELRDVTTVDCLAEEQRERRICFYPTNKSHKSGTPSHLGPPSNPSRLSSRYPPTAPSPASYRRHRHPPTEPSLPCLCVRTWATSRPKSFVWRSVHVRSRAEFKEEPIDSGSPTATGDSV